MCGPDLGRPPPQHWVLGLRSEAPRASPGLLLHGFPSLPLLRKDLLSVHFLLLLKPHLCFPHPAGEQVCRLPGVQMGQGDLDPNSHGDSRGDRVEEVLPIILGCSRNQVCEIMLSPIIPWATQFKI